MSIATPKPQAKEPIQLVMFVCRKRERDKRQPSPPPVAFQLACEKSFAKAMRLRSTSQLELSRNDRRVILYSQFLAEPGPVEGTSVVASLLDQHQRPIEDALDAIPFFAPVEPATSEDKKELTQRTLF